MQGDWWRLHPWEPSPSVYPRRSTIGVRLPSSPGWFLFPDIVLWLKGRFEDHPASYDSTTLLVRSI